MNKLKKYFITHYYNKSYVSIPFMSLSDLDDKNAISLMEKLYDDKTEYGKRFQQPLKYLNSRRKTELWVRNEFIKKGFHPEEINPLYFVLGTSQWIENQVPGDFKKKTVRFELEKFQYDEISFTYPDSMVSKWLSEEKPVGIYNAKYHGKVFSIEEIKEIVDRFGFPEYSWNTNFPKNIAPYIEAQVWTRKYI